MSFSEFVSDVKFPMGIKEFDRKMSEANELCKRGEISDRRLCGIRDMLTANIDDNAKFVLAERRRAMNEKFMQEMREDIMKLALISAEIDIVTRMAKRR